MDILAFYMAPAFAPFTAAIAVVLVIFLVEMVFTVLAGAGLASLVDSLIDTHSLPDSTFTNWLLVKEVPMLMVFVSLLASFGLTGTAIQTFASMVFQTTVPVAVAVVLSLFGAYGAVRGLSVAVRRLRLVHTTALTAKEFIGQIATLTSPTAYHGYAGAANFTDLHGYVHLVMVEPNLGGGTFEEGDRVELVSRVSSSLFLARKA